jgi:hypothetical protein
VFEMSFIGYMWQPWAGVHFFGVACITLYQTLVCVEVAAFGYSPTYDDFMSQH